MKEPFLYLICLFITQMTIPTKASHCAKVGYFMNKGAQMFNVKA